MTLRGIELLQVLKAAATCKTTSLCLAAGAPPVALLRPVACEQASESDEDVGLLTEGRNRFVTSFLHEFTANRSRTANWLRETIGKDDTRILFMVDDCTTGNTIGYMGLAYIDWEQRYGEADAIVRVHESRKGIMRQSLTTLLSWAAAELELETLAVRVRSDNPALHFYQQLGFRETKRESLVQHPEDDGTVRWQETAEPGSPLQLVHMVYAP